MWSFVCTVKVATTWENLEKIQKPSVPSLAIELSWSKTARLLILRETGSQNKMCLREGSQWREQCISEGQGSQTGSLPEGGYQ